MFCAECECVRVCVCMWSVGKRVWTSKRYCWRFSARPLGKRAEGCKEIFEGAEKASRLVQFPFSTIPDSGISGMHLCGSAEATKPGRQVHLYDPSVLVHCPF